MATRRELRDIISGYGKQCFFSIAQVTEMLGVKDRRTAKKFVADLDAVNINGRQLYFINDIAKKLDVLTERS